MKTRIKYIIALLVVTTTFSCDQYVDIEAQGFIIPYTVDELQQVLNEEYFQANSTYAAPFFMTDDFIIPPSKQTDFRSTYVYHFYWENIYGFEDHFYTVEETDGAWSYNYEAIGIANYVLDKLELVDGGSDLDRDNVKGEALVIRAAAYYNLVNLYSKHYAAIDPNTAESGVPLLTEFANPDADLTRASIQEVYDLIISDLTTATPLIKDSTKSLGEKQYASIAAAYGLLARTYLQVGKYQLAIDAANNSLNLQSDLLTYSTDLTDLNNTLGDPTGLIRPQYYNPKEIIMHRRGNSIPFYVKNVFVGGVFQSVVRKFNYLSDDLTSIFDQTYDMRYTKLTESESGFRRWRGGDSSYPYNLSDLTVPEVMLIRAECNARLNNTSAALADVNTIRTYRFTDTAPANVVELTASSPEEALTIVKAERRRELLGRGVRFFDIKRYNAVDGDNISITHTNFDGVDVTLEANTNKWALPIPRKEIYLAPEISQNPR